MSDTNQYMKAPLLMNRIMIRLLRSPLHSLWSPFHGSISRSVMLITFTGRKSGKAYTTPVSYVRDGKTVMAFTQAAWARNLRGGAPVTLRLAGKDYTGTAVATIDDKVAVADSLAAFLQHMPRDARFYDVKFDDNKRPDPADVARAAQHGAAIRIYLN